MACPFLEAPEEVGAQIVRGSLRRARVFKDRSDPLSFSDDYLYERYRFSSEGIIYLCQLLEPSIARETRRSKALTVCQTVCLALRYFVSGSYMYSVGDAESLSKNTVCRSIRQVVVAISKLLDAFVVFPGHLPMQAIQEGFSGIAGFPRVIGAIDCTHIRISAPLGKDEGDYANHKGFHSLNVQMTCDHNCLITSLDAKWPGRVHDSRIFQESTLCHRLEQGQFHGVLLGDRGYACTPFMMTPYPNPDPGPQTRYNEAHASTRAKIENTLGILKARFSCLRGLRVVPDRASQVVSACVVLHNIAGIRKEREPPITMEPPDVIDPITLDLPSGTTVRETITQQFFT